MVTSTEQPLTQLSSQEAKAIANLRGVLLPEGFNKWVLDERYLDLAPTDEQRAWMKDRAETLRSCLKTATPDHIRTQLMSMFVTMKQRNPGSSADARKVVDTYIADLSGVPLRPFLEACAVFRRGDVGEGWLPTPAELRQETNLRAMRPQQELFDIQAILRARIPVASDPIETRKAAVARWNDIVQPVLEHAQPPNEVPKPKDAGRETRSSEEIIADLEKKFMGAPPCEVSPALLKKVAKYAQPTET
jgi:hypothetical protein